MGQIRGESPYAALMSEMAADCSRCRGLCCTELYFSRCDGFPADKAAGVPCAHLTAGFRCDIHGELAERGLKGCMAYDCFGAGQAACEGGGDFHRLFRLRQMRWELAQAASLKPCGGLRDELDALMAESGGAEDIDAFQERVNAVLKRAVALVCDRGRPRRRDLAGRRLRGDETAGRDLSMVLLIAANLRGCSLRGTSLLGADLRDADLSGADLSECVFLTQGQVNGARGDEKTKLPPARRRPEHGGGGAARRGP